MATKTDRIMSYLPGTFKAAQSRSALKAVVDTFGTELRNAENALAALMRAHWVDHADFGAGKIDDLAKMAALYGLAPRADEDVEEFRKHLQQYVKTMLEGSVTVQGILRVTADSLGLEIADRYEDMDTWWTRDTDELFLQQHSGQDVAVTLFGKDQPGVTGEAQQLAQIKGGVNLDQPVDLTGNGLFSTRTLRIKINGKAKITIDLTASVVDPASASAAEIIAAVNDAFGAQVATLNNGRLVLSALQAGDSSLITVEEHPKDAATILLGLLPHIAKGEAAQKAQLTSEIDLSGTIDLTNARYLRMSVDGQLAEIDCAGVDPAASTIDEVCSAINVAFGSSVATNDGQFIQLAAATTGVAGSIAFLQAAAQDAVKTLFGRPPTVVLGSDKSAAQLVGELDLRAGVDLSEHYFLRFKVNAGTSVNVDCRGVEPANTQLPEVVNVINATAGKNIASHNGKQLVLTSTTQGATSRIAIEPLDDNDATFQLMGIASRTASGSDATSARIESEVDLSAGVNLFAASILRLSIDNGVSVDIDVKSQSNDTGEVTLNEIVEAINFELGDSFASHDGSFLALTSKLSGSHSQVSVLPFELESRRRFVTRASILNEATDKIFGFNQASASGEEALPAEVNGTPDLDRGVDLRESQFLSIQINQSPPVDIDCAGPRPRATLISEIIDNINTVFSQRIAFDNVGKLKLIAPFVDDDLSVSSRIAFHLPRVTDAMDTLLSVPTGLVRGSGATTVTFIGVEDLGAGVDLGTENSINIKIDNDGPLEINCAGLVPGQTTPAQIAIAINVAFGKNYAGHDGKHVIITSLLKGNDSIIQFEPTSGPDATSRLFGIPAPRLYQGAAATSALVQGQVELGGDVTDLSLAHFLDIAVDGAGVVTVDCGASAVNREQVTRDEIVDAINSALDETIASHNNGFLNLESPTTGISSRINLQPHTGSDARNLLFGQVSDVHEGSAAVAATLEGDIDLTQGVDLTERFHLRLSVDGQRGLDIAVLGSAQEIVFGEEVVAAINEQLPGIALLTDTGHIQLTSPTPGAQSAIDVWPIRYLELQEYIPTKNPSEQIFDVQHGSAIHLQNGGVTEVVGEIVIVAPNGVFGTGVVNEDTGWQLRCLEYLHPGEELKVEKHPRGGILASISDPSGATRKVSGVDIIVGPLLPQMHVPTDDQWRLGRGNDGRPGMTLNNFLAPNLLVLHSLQSIESDIDIQIRVTQANPGTVPFPVKEIYTGTHEAIGYQFHGRLARQNDDYELLDAADQVLVTVHANGGIDFSNFQDQVVVLRGTLDEDSALINQQLFVNHIARLFDVSIIQHLVAEPDVEEQYPGVSIGEHPGATHALERNLVFSGQPSRILRAQVRGKQAILEFPRGRSDWRYVECHSARFDVALFNQDRFVGDPGVERGLFNISSFDYQPPQRITRVFAESDAKYLHTIQVRFDFLLHQPGTMRVNLPADLAQRFGGRFNQSVFGVEEAKPEEFKQVVTEPDPDPDNLIDRINNDSILATAARVDVVPLGYSAATIPYRRPVFFTLGSRDQEAKLYLSENEVPGFIELSARSTGSWGNSLSLLVCDAGPAIFDLILFFAGSKFENARQTVLGDDLTAVVSESLKPGAMGVRQAKAAGVKVDVTRGNQVFGTPSEF